MRPAAMTLALVLAAWSAGAQAPEPLPESLTQMVETERAFAAFEKAR